MVEYSKTQDLSKNNFFHEHYDECTFLGCGHKFLEAEWTFFGKDINGNYHHVCDRHVDQIEWLAMQIFGHLVKEDFRTKTYTIPSYKNPPGPKTDILLWRYMNLKKFKDFIKTKSLFFPKAIRFNDPLECAVSIQERVDWLNGIRNQVYKILNQNESQDQNHMLEIYVKNQIENNKFFRKEVLISCWHANDHESEAMWQLYKGKKHNTVAISIKMGDLRNSLPKIIHFGHVSYVDYQEIYPTKVRAFCKHVSYEHEEEIRAVIFPEHISNSDIKKRIKRRRKYGLLIKPDEKFLQISVYISPWCDDNFRSEVKSLIFNSSWNIGNKPNPSISFIVETKYEPIY